LLKPFYEATIMAQAFTTTSLQALLAYPFRDPEWRQKLLIGSLLMLAGFLIPILPWILASGYYAAIMQQIIQKGGEPYLPDWQDWGALFSAGLRLCGAGLIYTLPLWILLLGSYALFVLPVFLASFVETGGGQPPPSLELLPLAGTGIGTVGFGLALALGILTGIVLPAAIGHLVAKNEFGAAFRVGEWWPVFRANLSGFLLTYVLLMGLSYLSTFAMQLLMVTVVLCCLVPLVLGPLYHYLGLMSAALYAQAYRTGSEKRAELSVE
jgi:hypothetical protein